MNEHHAVNRTLWNEITPVHAASDFYDVEGFLAGRSTLGAVERAAVGNVAGKRLLHLQCHFGLDTLSWARLGAAVVGLDFSNVAVARARDLARRAGLDDRARFVEGDVTASGAVEGGPFDIVFTSLGTVTWLHDLEGWAATVAANLAADGFFYFLDAHPASLIFDETRTAPAVRYAYFHDETPLLEPAGSVDYADPGYRTRSPSHQFIWDTATILRVLEARGLTIHELREYPFGAWLQFPDMRKGPDGYWHRGKESAQLPLLLGFKARR